MHKSFFVNYQRKAIVTLLPKTNPQKYVIPYQGGEMCDTRIRKQKQFFGTHKRIGRDTENIAYWLMLCLD